jgi:hypothetical protein
MIEDYRRVWGKKEKVVYKETERDEEGGDTGLILDVVEYKYITFDENGEFNEQNNQIRKILGHKVVLGSFLTKHPPPYHEKGRFCFRALNGTLASRPSKLGAS